MSAESQRCAELSKRIAELEQQLLDTQHELAIRMDRLHEYPWCCELARSSNGWHHDFNCKNFTMCY